MGIRNYVRWRRVCLFGLWLAGALVMASRMMASEPAINLVGYTGGLLLASCVVLNVLRRDAKPQDWVMLLGMVLLVVYGWLADFSGATPAFFSDGDSRRHRYIAGCSNSGRQDE